MLDKVSSVPSSFLDLTAKKEWVCAYVCVWEHVLVQNSLIKPLQQSKKQECMYECVCEVSINSFCWSCKVWHRAPFTIASLFIFPFFSLIPTLSLSRHTICHQSFLIFLQSSSLTQRVWDLVPCWKIVKYRDLSSNVPFKSPLFSGKEQSTKH